MCRVCQKRPEIPDERYSRCEACAKAGRIPYRFRAATGRGGTGLVIRAGELSPHALHSKLRDQLRAYTATPKQVPALGLHYVELITANKGTRLESIRVSPDLAARCDEVVEALRTAAERSDTAW